MKLNYATENHSVIAVQCPVSCLAVPSSPSLPTLCPLIPACFFPFCHFPFIHTFLSSSIFPFRSLSLPFSPLPVSLSPPHPYTPPCPVLRFRLSRLLPLPSFYVLPSLFHSFSSPHSFLCFPFPHAPFLPDGPFSSVPFSLPLLSLIPNSLPSVPFLSTHPRVFS